MGINNIGALFVTNLPTCAVVIDGEVCGHEEFATIHMTADGHDFQR